MKRIAAPISYLLLCCAIGATFPAHAMGQAAPEKLSQAEIREQAELLAVEDVFFRAQMRRDFAGVANALGNEAVFKTASGSQNKAQFLQTLRSEKTARNLVASDRIGTMAGALGVTYGTLRTTIGGRTVTNRYVTSYLKRGGRWQLVSWQSMPPLPRR